MIEADLTPDPEWARWVGERPDDYLPPVPDAVDLVLETATMMSVFAAQRLVRVERLRREEVASLLASGSGFGAIEVAERSVRLELASAMRITEYAAGRLTAQAEALVNRYPAALDALSVLRERTTGRPAQPERDWQQVLGGDGASA